MHVHELTDFVCSACATHIYEVLDFVFHIVFRKNDLQGQVTRLQRKLDEAQAADDNVVTELSNAITCYQQQLKEEKDVRANKR